jgi:hypothetical protein
MSYDDARMLAEKLIETTDLRGYRAAYSGARRSSLVPTEWDVVFDVVAPGGDRVSGGLVVVVDQNTRAARLSDSL